MTTIGIGLRTVVQQLRADATSPVRQRTFEQGRSRQPVFAGYPNVRAVLDALADDHERTYPERERLTRALLAEARGNGGSCWRSILVVAYYPLLSRLRRRIIGDAIPREDLDQLVLTAFLSAIDALQPHECVDRTAMRLRQRTARQVFRLLRRARSEQLVPNAVRDLGPDAALLGVVPSDHADAEREDVAERERQFVEIAEGTMTEGNLDVLLATVIRRESLRDYVRRTVKGEALVRERAYQRMKKQRARALRRLRLMLGVSPPPDASGF